jgi:hypothetical protein
MTREDVEEHIRKKMDEGITVDSNDFEGQNCAYCDELIPFTDWPENVVFWNVRIQEPGEDATEFFARYYLCSETCKEKLQRDPDASAQWDRIHEDELWQ